MGSATRPRPPDASLDTILSKATTVSRKLPRISMETGMRCRVRVLPPCVIIIPCVRISANTANHVCWQMSACCRGPLLTSPRACRRAKTTRRCSQLPHSQAQCELTIRHGVPTSSRPRDLGIWGRGEVPSRVSGAGKHPCCGPNNSSLSLSLPHPGHGRRPLLARLSSGQRQLDAPHAAIYRKARRWQMDMAPTLSRVDVACGGGAAMDDANARCDAWSIPIP